MSPRCSPLRSRPSAGRSAAARSRWPSRSRRPSATASTCSSRPAPAPASRWPTSCRRCSITTASWSPPRRSPCSTSWSSGTSRGSSRRSATRLDATYAVLKGRSNYACLHRIREGVPDDQGALVDVPTGSMAEKVLELRAWAEKELRGRRHRRARQRAAPHRPRVAAGQREPPRVPGRHEVPVRGRVLRRAGAGEGAALPPDRHQPLAARDRRDRGRADDPRLRRGGHRRGPRADRPGHPGRDRRARGQRHRAGIAAFASAGSRTSRPTRWARPPTLCPRRSPRRHPAGSTTCPTSSATRSCWCATPPASASRPSPRTTPGADGDAGRTQAKGMVQEVFVNAERMAANLESDVLWLGEARDRIPARLHVAPLQVWGPMRDKLLTDKTVVFTSATLMLGGDFDAVATSLGLKPAERDRRADRRPRRRRAAVARASTSGRRSTTASRRSSTSPATCRRPAATASGRPSSTRSASWSMPPAGARSACSRPAGRPRPPPRRCASGCPT